MVLATERKPLETAHLGLGDPQGPPQYQVEKTNEKEMRGGGREVTPSVPRLLPAYLAAWGLFTCPWPGASWRDAALETVGPPRGRE